MDELAMAPKSYDLVSIDDALVDALNSRGISFLQSSLQFDRQGLMKCHAEAAAEFKIMVDDAQWAKWTFSHHVLDPWRPSACLNYLKTMVLADLKPPNALEDPHGIPLSVHHGHYVSGKLCVKAFRTGGVRTVFEDREGRAVPVVIDNAVCSTASEANVGRMYPEGMEVIIKEPTYTQLWKDGTLGFIVASPADVLPSANIILCANARMLYENQRPAGWRLGLKYVEEICGRGKKHLIDDQCTTALSCYNFCVSLMEKISLDSKRRFSDSGNGDKYPQQERVNASILEYIHTKRCETFLRLGLYNFALEDARTSLQLNPSNAKAQMLRRAICLHGLHRYREEVTCLEDAQVLASLGTSDSDRVFLQEISDQKSRASICMLQSGKGIYEFDDQEFTRLSGTKRAPGCAPFVGSIKLRTNRESVTACAIGGWEPRMVASQDVEQGELLLVTNPLAQGGVHLAGPRIRYYSRRPPRTSAEPDIWSWSAQFQNTLVNAIAKAQLSPQYAAQLRSMMRGKRMEQPSLKLFTEVGNDAKYNGYVGSNLKMDQQLHLERVDIRDIRCVLATNGLVDGALYGLPSFFKHSCAPNCVYYTDSMHSRGAMFIAATRRIPAGEELSIHGVSLFHSASRRSEQLSRHRGEDLCSCPRCTFENQTFTDIPELQQVLYRYNSDIEARNLPFRVYDKHEVEPALLANLDSEGRYDPFRAQLKINRSIKVETDDDVEHWVQDVLNIDDYEDMRFMLTACLEVKERVERILLLCDDFSHVHLSRQQKDWIRCSFALAYVFPVLFCPGNVAANFIDEIVQFLTAVEPGTSSALTILTLSMHKVEHSGIDQILQKRFKNLNLYLPFKEKSYDNLLNWGCGHFNSFLSYFNLRNAL